MASAVMQSPVLLGNFIHLFIMHIYHASVTCRIFSDSHKSSLMMMMMAIRISITRVGRYPTATETTTPDYIPSNHLFFVPTTSE